MTDTYTQPQTVATDALATLGTVLRAGDQKRDAIHLACISIKANQDLMPGDHVQIDEEATVAYRCPPGVGVGIVDPFLNSTHGVKKGQWFWLVVYPRQINELRHVWEHPAFPPSEDGSAYGVLPPKPSKEHSMLYLKQYCDEDYGSVDKWANDAAHNALNGYVTVWGRDASGPVPAELWDHLENYLGRSVKRPDEAYFSCSC